MEHIKRAKQLFIEGKLDEAETTLAGRVDAAALYLLAHVRLNQACTDEALKILRHLAHNDPLPRSHSDYLFYGLHKWTTSNDPAHRRWYERFAKDAKRPQSTYEGKRPLRIGYLSPNLRAHTVASFFEPIIANHTDAVQVVVYCDNAKDAATLRMSQCNRNAAWRDVTRLDDGALFRQIRKDGVDVLIDLTGHMDSGHRQQVVAAWPAPNVVNYIGYPHATGQAGAYRVTDAVCDPVDTGENLLRLDGCCWAFRPGDDAPDVTPLPADANGYVTFGSMHRACKITPQTVRTWHRLLDSVPNSKLLVLCVGGESNSVLRRMFDGRVELVPMGNRDHYFQTINRTDIALDVAPYSSMTVCLDNLWQGVPTVAIAGGHAVSRASASILTAVGLTDLVATTADQYVDIAASLASNRDRSNALRHGLRQTMTETICDGKRVAMGLEEALRSISINAA
jgi:protein O-GlcNAc transferase